ncbi:MAG: outer membrane beta-barrel protein [Pseudomonadota bacterium]
MSATPSFAQDSQASASAEQDYYSRNKYVAVTDRVQEAFDPVEMNWGAFVAQPEFNVGVTSDSNLFASETNEESDIVTHIGAGLDVRSNWSQNELGFSVAGRQNEYADFSNESNFGFRSKLRGRLDVSRTLSVRGEAIYEDNTEDRTLIANSTANVEPIQFGVAGGTIGADYQNDRTRLSAQVSIADRNFDDGRDAAGAEFDQDFRDHTTTTSTVYASYALTPNIAAFAQATATNLDYDIETVSGGTVSNRDSSGYNLQGGVDFELSSLLRGRVGIGYLENDRDDENLQDIDGVTVDGQVQWFPSQIVTVTFDASRRVEDQGLIEAPNAIATRFGLRADYELRRNVILSAAGLLGELDFDDDARSDDFTELSLSATYKLNRRVHLDAFARNIERDSDGFLNNVGQPFQKNVIGVGLSLYPY